MDDKAFRRTMIDVLDREPSVNAARIGVAVENGVVTLSGHVGTCAEKLAAEQAVRRVKGVRAVASEIRVCASGRTASDAEIARRAPVVIAWHAHIPDGAVAVQVDNGWVTLAGMVEDAFEREAAETGVRRLDGVVGVTNLIETRTASGDGACSCSQSKADEFRASAANDGAVLQSPAPWRSGVLEQIAGWLRS